MGVLVEILTISPKFQVAIPRSIRERLGLGPGQFDRLIVPSICLLEA